MKTSLIFLLGIGLGTIIGLLTAPESGKITRKKIRDEADRIIDKALAKKEKLEEEAAEEMPDVVIVAEERYTI